MYSAKAEEIINLELDHAREARERGLEGRARVCARRACGVAIREYLHRHLPAAANEVESAYDLLKIIQDLPGIPAEIREAAGRLRLRVDQKFKLPDDIDPIAEAIRLIEALDSELPLHRA